MVKGNIQLDHLDWAVHFIPAPDFVQVCWMSCFFVAGAGLTICTFQFVTPGARLPTRYEGQLDLLTFVRQGLAIDTATVESTVRRLLQAEGDLFTFQKGIGFDDGTLRAIIEYSDTTIALTTYWKYRHGLAVHVSANFTGVLCCVRSDAPSDTCVLCRVFKLCCPSIRTMMALLERPTRTRASRHLFPRRCGLRCITCHRPSSQSRLPTRRRRRLGR